MNVMTHAPSHLRDAFLDWMDSDEDRVEVEGEPRDIAWFADRLTKCRDVLPAGYCDMLDIPRGSSYAHAVREANAGYHLGRRKWQAKRDAAEKELLQEMKRSAQRAKERSGQSN